MQKTDIIAAKFLGKKTEGSSLYDSSLLVAVPRCENREHYNIDSENLPFEGWDIWHAYEFSSLTVNGLPVTRLMKIKYSCKSEFIVESKSLKLYLNSFNMSRYGRTVEECLNLCKKIIETDLSSKLQTSVEVNFIENYAQSVRIFENFKNLMEFVDETTLKIEKFKEAPELLDYEKATKTSGNLLYFDSLRSNCRVTHQPDFGDVFIYYKSKIHIKEESLVKYLCSFRNEYHFHEECCEMIFKRLYDLLNEEDELLVCALYTRRGGIDICPLRLNKNCKTKFVEDLINTKCLARNGVKQ